MEIRQITDVRQLQTVSPQFILSQRLLQLTSIELIHEIEVEIAENPALELVEVMTCPYCHRPVTGNRCENCGRKTKGEEESLDSFISRQKEEYADSRTEYEESEGDWEDEPIRGSLAQQAGSFHDFLMTGFLSSPYPEELRELGEYLIYSIDDNGFLKYDPEELKEKFSADEESIQTVVKIIQSLEPVGVGAATPKEALLIQLKALEEEGKGNELAEKLIAEYFEELGRSRLDNIAEAIGVPASKVHEALDYIRRNLNPYPARAYSGKLPEPVAMPKPAITIKLQENSLVYEILELADFQLRISRTYIDMYDQCSNGGPGVGREEISHIREYFRRAKFFLDNIEMRKETLEKIAKALCSEQKDFLIKGLPNFNAELTQGRLAEKINLHESTVSRAMSGKYVQVPSGDILSFDFFFDSSVRLKEYMKNLIANEDPDNPISDSDLRERLLAKGIDVARRTIAKYREEMGIPSSYDRRRIRRRNGD